MERIDMLDTKYSDAISRGYDPQTGVPLGCPDENFDGAASVPGSDAALYQHVLGIDQETAERIIRIQQTDPRDCTEEDWQLLRDMVPGLL